MCIIYTTQDLSKCQQHKFFPRKSRGVRKTVHKSKIFWLSHPWRGRQVETICK